MKIIGKVSLLIGLLLLLSACQTNVKKIPTPIGQELTRVNPVDVQTKYINEQALEPLALDIASGNLFDNGGFENGLNGWTACSAGAIQTSSDAFEGTGALEVVPNNCFYRSAEVSPNQDLVLSCYVKVISGSAWTGMGMGFADSNWSIVGEAPATVISGSAYARYDVEFTAPTNSKYASMWIFSENVAVIDNCSLMLEAAPPPPPPPSGDNLLENGNFETLSSGNPKEWSQGCGGSASSVAGREGKGFSLSGGVCVDQGLSAGDVAALSGKDYTYSCYAKNTGGYASLSTFLDNVSVSTIIPVSNDYQFVELKGTAPQASGGFVSIYSEGGLTVDQCSLSVDDFAPPSNNENLLENSDFERFDANGQFSNWSIGCGGSWLNTIGRSGNGLNLQSGACASQSLSESDLTVLSGKEFTFSCYAKKYTGYASLSIFFDNSPITEVIPFIPDSSGFQLIEVKGTAPVVSSGLVSLYGEGNLFIDDCSLTVEDAQSVTCVDPVNIPDANFEAAIRSELGNPTGAITCADLLSLESLTISGPLQGFLDIGQRINSLEGIQFASNLTQFSFNTANFELTNISQLANLTNLETLGLRNNQITDISSLSNLTQLRVLDLNRNEITDITPLSNLSNLTELRLINNSNVNDITTLEFLPNLQTLRIGGTNVSDITPLIRNSGIGQGDDISLPANTGISSSDANILRTRGVTVTGLGF